MVCRLVAEIESEFRNHGELILAVTADVRRLSQQTALIRAILKWEQQLLTVHDKINFLEEYL